MENTEGTVTLRQAGCSVTVSSLHAHGLHGHACDSCIHQPGSLGVNAYKTASGSGMMPCNTIAGPPWLEAAPSETWYTFACNAKLRQQLSNHMIQLIVITARKTRASCCRPSLYLPEACQSLQAAASKHTLRCHGATCGAYRMAVCQHE
jgi:hypothetical protein